MKYAVEARIFHTGKIVTKVRPALDGEEDRREETRTCDIWIDVFETIQEAQKMAAEYRKA